MGDFVADASLRAMQSTSNPARPTGKLRSTKRGASLDNSRDHNHLRRLPGPRKSRANPYEISPDKPMVTFTIPQNQLPDISPLRKDKKRALTDEATIQRSSASTRLAEKRKSRDALAVPAEEADVQSTPRRSPRKHATGDDLPAASPAENGTSFGRPYKQPFSEDDDDENEEEIKAVSGELHEVPAPEVEEVQAAPDADKSPAKRGQGRPRKSKSGGPGRPRKLAPHEKDSTPQSSAHKQGVNDSPVGQSVTTNPVGNEEGANLMPKLIPVRISQVPFDDADGRDDLAHSVLGAQQPATTHEGRPRKRKENPIREERAERPAKKTKSRTQPVDNEEEQPDRSRQSEDQEDEDGDDPEENFDGRRLFGQGLKLQQVFSSLSNVGLSSRNGERSRSSVDRDDADVKEIHRLCKKATASLKRRLEDDPETAGSLPDPPREFAAIQRRIRGLCGDNVDFPTNFNDDEKASEIYFHVIPDLIRLLKQTIETYEVIDVHDGRTTSSESITPDHLRNVKDLIALILEMGRAAVERYKKPPSDLVVVKPVKYDILAPLKKVNAALSRSLWSIEEAQITAKRRARLAAEMAEQRLAEEAEEEQRERENRIRKAWLQLHLERRNVEGIVPLKKSKHLHMPGPGPGVELDQNGQPFERVEVFARRIGPDPTHVAEARRKVWSLREISTLQSGLQGFAGVNVFRDIFRKYCHPRGDLNKYNVTEIVTIAADLKEHLAETQEKDQGEVDEWVQQIPVWTNVHAMLGQENEG